jgi:hypothetical protein
MVMAGNGSEIYIWNLILTLSELKIELANLYLWSQMCKIKIYINNYSYTWE